MSMATEMFGWNMPYLSTSDETYSVMRQDRNVKIRKIGNQHVKNIV